MVEVVVLGLAGSVALIAAWVALRAIHYVLQEVRMSAHDE